MRSWQPEPEALLVVTTTVADGDTAQRLARLALEARLAACVQVSAIASHYVWDGALVAEAEQRLVFKTTVAAHAALERLLLEHHPYAVPMVTAEPLVAVSEAYRAWVLQAVASCGFPEAAGPPRAAGMGLCGGDGGVAVRAGAGAGARSRLP